MAQKAEAPKDRITGKDISVHPFTTVATDKKIDPKSKKIFDELKVIVTSEAQSARVRITGKKKDESGNYEGRPVNHTGKLALVPFSERKGVVKVGEPSIEDVCRYFLVLELPGDKLESKGLTLEKGVEYQWSISKKDDQVIYTLTSEGKDTTTITAPADQVKAFGIAAVVRWKGNEADVSMTIE